MQVWFTIGSDINSKEIDYIDLFSFHVWHFLHLTIDVFLHSWLFIPIENVGQNTYKT